MFVKLKRFDFMLIEFNSISCVRLFPEGNPVEFVIFWVKYFIYELSDSDY